ncbi:hypothetical protein WDW37_06535 [Bdellovibrionota bacterium FG-1]
MGDRLGNYLPEADGFFGRYDKIHISHDERVHPNCAEHCDSSYNERDAEAPNVRRPHYHL